MGLDKKLAMDKNASWKARWCDRCRPSCEGKKRWEGRNKIALLKRRRERGRKGVGWRKQRVAELYWLLRWRPYPPPKANPFAP